jgi:hypothetical protein
VETASPTWNGSSWVGLICAPIPTAPDPTTLCTASVPSGYQLSGSITLQGQYIIGASWTNWNMVPGANLSFWIQYAEGVGYPVSSASDTTYIASARGPYVQIGEACNLQNTYEAVCLVSPGGNLDSVFAAAYGVSNGQCNH